MEAETPPIDVGVVVVTYNSAPVLSRLLDSLSAGLTGLHWRAVVVDNASSDSTVNIAEAGGIEVIRRQENGGYAAAINDGSRRFANARSILVLNPDCELTPWSVQKLLDELDADPTVGIAAPKTVLKNGTTLDPTLRREPSVLRTWAAIVLGGPLARRYAWASDAVVDPKRYETVQDADWVVGAVLLISRRCIDAIGDWDESFFLYSEEVDYCRRARQAGFAIRYTPAAVTLHEGGEGLVNPKLRAMMIVNKVRYFRRHHGLVASWAFYIGTLVHEVTRSVRRPASRAAALALVVASRRPSELGVSGSLMPR